MPPSSNAGSPWSATARRQWRSVRSASWARRSSRDEPAMNDREVAGTVPAASFQLLYTADEAAIMLRVKPRWLKRQAAARKVPFTMLAGSYRFSARHLEEIMRMHEKTPVAADPAGVPPQRAHRHRGAAAAGGASPPPARPRPRRLAPSPDG